MDQPQEEPLADLRWVPLDGEREKGGTDTKTMLVARSTLFWSIFPICLLLSCQRTPTKSAKANSQNPASSVEQGVIAPEVVRSEKVHIENGLKMLTVGNANGHYLLSCYTEAGGCITPEPNKNYLLINKNTYWKMPGAKDFITLTFVQDWTVTYKEAENIGLVPENGGGPYELGMYSLLSWEQEPLKKP
jgi:hypothetical protein